MTDFMIRTDGLTKQFGSMHAVDHLNWHVPAGSICGLLGPNGAGKTTTLKMLLGITRPTSGSAEIDGRNILTDSMVVRQTTGFLPEDKLIYEGLRIEEFLKLYSSFYPDWSAETAARMLSDWGLDSETKIKTLSKGNRSKVLLSAILARNSRLLLLDEPTDGLDPGGIEEILKHLAEWGSEFERTAVIATHRLDEVERICDRVSIIDNGKLLLDENLDDLRKSWKTIQAIGEVPLEPLKKNAAVHTAESEGISVRLITRANPDSALQSLKQYHVSNIEIFDMNLREIYLAVTSRKGGNNGFVENLV